MNIPDRYRKKGHSWQGLINLFRNVESDEMLHELLVLFFTINERDSLQDRYRIVQALLLSGLPQREIAEKLKVSIAKITAGSNEIKQISPKLEDYLKDQMLDPKDLDQLKRGD